MGIITNLSGMQIGFLGKPYNNWHFCLTFKACCWVFILSLCIFMLNSDSGKSSPGLDFCLQLLLSPLCSNQVAPACCCSGTAGVRFFSSSCLFFSIVRQFWMPLVRALGHTCVNIEQQHFSNSHSIHRNSGFVSNWTLRNVVNEFLGCKLHGKISNNHSPAGREQQGLQKSDRGVGHTSFSQNYTTWGLKVSRLRGRQTGLILDFSWG